MSEKLDCIHDFLDANTTIVVRPQEREAWCVGCGKRRTLKVLGDSMSRAAMAAREHMLFTGNGDKYDG